jgi:protein tyrosine/serine phosphatase
MDNSFIFTRQTDSAEQAKFFTFIGEHDFLDEQKNPRSTTEENEKTLAKLIIREDNSKKFMIKVDATHKPYNPISIYGNKQAYKKMDKTRPESKFISVNQEAFNNYVNFLRTRIVSWLHNTERSI